MTRLAALFLLTTACHGAAPPRYIASTQPSGAITFSPVGVADLDGDGDSGDADDFAIFQRERTAPGVKEVLTTQPEVPPYVPPVTPVSCTVTVGPTDAWQAAVNAAKPGDTICFRGGDYKADGGGWSWSACLAINKSGTPEKPITFRSVPGERPIFWGETFTYAIRVGWLNYDGAGFTPANNIILDGLCATHSPRAGIQVWKSNNVVIRNCEAFTNNYNAANPEKYQGYFYGIDIQAPAKDVAVDHCIVYDNGGGVSAYEESQSALPPVGVVNPVITNNFIFGNTRSENPANSSGIGLRFPDYPRIQGNVVYDNADANLNGEGHNFGTITGNICINSWQELPGANNEGGKINVRGGGANIIAGNLFVSNDNCGWDDAGGVGNVFLNNTVYGNGSYGIMAEGKELMMFNNIIAGNSTRLTDNAWPQVGATGYSAIWDWNLFGPGTLCVPGSDKVTLDTLPPNSQRLDFRLPGYPMARTGPREIVTPLQAFGTSNIETARSQIFAAYKPATPIRGALIADISKAVNANLPQVMSALDAAITGAASSPDHQMKQATSRWLKLKSELKSYDLSKLGDGGYCGAVK